MREARWSRDRVVQAIFAVALLFVGVQGLPQSVNDVLQPGPGQCTGSYKTGACKSFVHKWYYDETIGKCRTFIYGGCDGNANRFNSEAQCMHYCVGGEEHTLPPYLQSPLDFDQPSSTTAPPKTTTDADSDDAPRLLKSTPPAPPVPVSKRGEELTFEETGHHRVFMFAQRNTFIQLDANRIPNFQLRLCREISFQFRTRLPHGLLVYHSVKNRPEGLDPYALYVIVENGQLKVVHVFGKHSTSLTVGQGLNRDEWHTVTVSIDVHGARLIATVDSIQEETKILGLQTANNYGVPTDLPSVVLVGGLSSEEKLHGVKYIIESFVGCIRSMRLSAGKAASDLLPIKPLIATKHENVVEGCINKCKTKENLCFVGSKCVNHYNSLTCDCYGMKYEGEQCDIYTGTVLTLRGSSYISYRVYDWRDRVKSSFNRVSLFFKTRYDDSALFYASGEPFKHHYIAAAIKNRTVVVEVDFGDGPLHIPIGNGVTNNYWNNLTIIHHNHDIRVVLNEEAKLLELPGKRHHLYIDPEIYIGGGPDLANRNGLASQNNFAGSLKYVFFNDISVIYELKKANPKVHYIGVLEPEIYEADVETIPITFPFPSSHIWWENTHQDSFSLAFGFRSSRTMAILASSEVTTETGRGFWELRVVNDEIRFELVPDGAQNITHLTTVKFESRSSWHKVELSYANDSIKLSVDHKYKSAQVNRLHFQPGHNITLALGVRSTAGLVGCMRDISVNGVPVEPRAVVRSNHAVGEVSLDNCVLVDPCSRPNTCEHGGKCSVKDEKILCDCSGTGYIGNSCHFAEFRKTCEELALLGYTRPDVYLIDIDGNGPFPPAHVKCEFQSFEESTKTIVEHNLPSQIDVRSPSEEDFSFSIKYREFSAEMLQELISHSLNCSQYIKYDCYKAPLELHSATWFISSATNDIVDYIGNVKRGSCPCAVNRTCLNPSQRCNCDISEGKWHSDEGYYTTPESLGIMQMVFLQQKEMSPDAQGRITLGPLECVETNTQQYVVTFTSSQSYIEVPGWRKGDISFSFRTTGKQAILLYQPPIRPHHPSFMVALTSDFHLTFNFTLNNGGTRELLIKSQRKLNGGEWQKIWIDYNEHHVRFMINTDYEMVDLLPDQEFGPFEGSMFIGGATEDLLANSTVRQGLIGCFRGLVVNGEILDIYSYMSVHLSEIIKDCKPSCDPSPCKNGAQCTELWSTFQCVCENPWAHIGTYCETNINTDAMTFVAPDAYIKRNYLGDVTDEEKQFLKHLLNEDILVNLRTYSTDALVVYANDNLNNFVQIYIRDGQTVIFAFNVGNEIKSISVDYPGLNSGKSVQIAIIRKADETVVHVNEKKNSLAVPILLLTQYANKPWTNPEQEVLAPQRPPAPPTEYFQTNIGGYDTQNLIAGTDAPALGGFVGCIRGLKIGDHVVNLASQMQFAVSTDPGGVRSGCRMKCDEVPCKNQGVCMEDFAKGESSCNCEHTSYYGELCATEKGADFGGESVLKRKYLLDSPVNQVKVQLAFSSSDHRQHRTVLLLLQTDSSSNYYLLVALTGEGHLVFEEDRDGGVDQRSMGATIKDRHFLNGARHSVYYQRTNDSAVLLIDREEVPLELIPVMSMTDVKKGELGANQVQVGGFNSADPRFVAYKSYSGCLSNVVVEVNHHVMKPLEEYMLFTKFGSEEVEVVNAAGVRSAQCADFDLVNKPQSGMTLNMSLGLHKPWVEDPPQRVEYKSTYANVSIVETGSTQVIFLILTTFFAAVVILSLCLVYRNNQSYRKRKRKEETDAAILWQKGQPSKYQDPTLTSYKPVPQKDVKKPQLNGTDKNGSDFKPIVKNDYVQIPLSPPGDEKPVENGIDDDNGKQTQVPVSVEEVPRPHHHSIAEEDEDGVGEDEEEQELLDIPSSKPGQEVGSSQNDSNSPSSTFADVGSETRDPLRPAARGTERALVPGALLSPVFLSDEQRTFGNPISYLGGPRLTSPNTTRASKESVLSLD